jgi:two-component system sensor histidine kinase RstB
LAQQFDLMADRMQTLLDDQRHLIQAVSHELRTPAARIRFGLEMLSTARSVEERQRRIDSMDEDLSELDQLVEELVLFVRSGDFKIEQRPVSLPDPTRQLVDKLAEDYPQIRFELESPGELVAMVDENLFLRAIRNLLTNAARHARGQVTVGLERIGTMVSIAVQDDGPGIPPNDRKRVFEPFTRLGDSRSRDSGGIGLGLTIVKRIVESHGGTAAIEDAPWGGAVLVTTWPRVA